MAIPTNAFSAEIFLILSLLLLGLWSSTFKMAGQKWRFEVFSLDFAVGGLLFSLLAAYTLGNFGAELGFNEHLMIASRTNQALAFGAGGLFAFAYILLLAGCALLGISIAYPIATGAALLVLAGLNFNGNRAVALGSSAVAALLAIFFAARGASKGEATLPAIGLPVMVRKSASGRTPRGGKSSDGFKNSSKGVIASLVSGITFGGLYQAFHKSIFDDLGLGPFAGVLIFWVGVVVGTVILSLFFMNVAIHGGRISANTYFRGGIFQHLLGLIGGALCVGGILLPFVVRTFPTESRPETLWIVGAVLFASVLAAVVGLIIWREHSAAAPSILPSLLIGALLLAVASGLFAMAIDKAPPPAGAPQTSGLSQAQLPG